MDTIPHNGYPNRATWLVQLHLTNDEPIYRMIRDGLPGRVKASIEWWWATADEQHIDVMRHVQVTVATMLETLVREMSSRSAGREHYPVARAMLVDLVHNTLREVDWDHLADVWLEDEVEWDELLDRLPDDAAFEVRSQWERNASDEIATARA